MTTKFTATDQRNLWILRIIEHLKEEECREVLREVLFTSVTTGSVQSLLRRFNLSEEITDEERENYLNRC